MSDYKMFALQLHSDVFAQAVLQSYVQTNKHAYSYALGYYWVEMESKLSQFVELWNEGAITVGLMGSAMPDSVQLQALADSYQIPLTFAVNGTVSINV